ncbi:hypothetical protein F6P95_17530 [Escherichia coli]|nr:hypothetical protein F6P95_17530 [Escherichia coli]
MRILFKYYFTETGVCSVKKIITSSTSCFLALFRTGTHITTSNKNVKLKPIFIIYFYSQQ